MSDSISVYAEVKFTPKLMAAAFWGMDSVEQAMFFAELKDVIGDGDGEMQWCYLSGELNKNPKAKGMACALMAWVFLHSTDYLSRYPT